MYAIQVGLDFRNAAASCQGLYKCHKRASHYSVSNANAHKCCKRGPKAACDISKAANDCLTNWAAINRVQQRQRIDAAPCQESPTRATY